MAASKRPGEFELIEQYFRPLAKDRGAFRLIDDAALYRQRPDEDLVLTTDTVAAGVHFFADDPPESIARKALRVNLSDLAAKGADAYGYLLSLALPADWTEGWMKQFAAGLAGDQKTYGVSLLGGDTTRAAGGLTINVTAIGRVPRGQMVQRSGARAGDALFVSGTIGDGALGLRIRQQTRGRKARGSSHLIDRYLHPQPRVGLAPVLRTYASAAMDISDGLVGDLAHLCAASAVGAEIEADRIPLSAAAKAALAADHNLVSTILNGGDDYEVLVAVPVSATQAFAKDAAANGIPVSRIGQVTGKKGAPVVRDGGGKVMKLSSLSHTHF